MYSHTLPCGYIQSLDVPCLLCLLPFWPHIYLICVQPIPCCSFSFVTWMITFPLPLTLSYMVGSFFGPILHCNSLISAYFPVLHGVSITFLQLFLLHSMVDRHSPPVFMIDHHLLLSVTSPAVYGSQSHPFCLSYSSLLWLAVHVTITPSIILSLQLFVFKCLLYFVISGLLHKTKLTDSSLLYNG